MKGLFAFMVILGIAGLIASIILCFQNNVNFAVWVFSMGCMLMMLAGLHGLSQVDERGTHNDI